MTIRNEITWTEQQTFETRHNTLFIIQKCLQSTYYPTYLKSRDCQTSVYNKYKNKQVVYHSGRAQIPCKLSL